jgi:hypothetical protein
MYGLLPKETCVNKDQRIRELEILQLYGRDVFTLDHLYELKRLKAEVPRRVEITLLVEGPFVENILEGGYDNYDITMMLLRVARKNLPEGFTALGASCCNKPDEGEAKAAIHPSTWSSADIAFLKRSESLCVTKENKKRR